MPTRQREVLQQQHGTDRKPLRIHLTLSVYHGQVYGVGVLRGTGYPDIDAKCLLPSRLLQLSMTTCASIVPWERLLRASGFETNTFGSAEEFLANHTPESHACLILDAHLPGMSGFELFDRLSAFEPWLPVILVTADSRESIRHQTYPISDAICLQKPFAGTVLLEAVRRNLGAGISIQNRLGFSGI